MHRQKQRKKQGLNEDDRRPKRFRRWMGGNFGLKYRKEEGFDLSLGLWRAEEGTLKLEDEESFIAAISNLLRRECKPSQYLLHLWGDLG